MYQLAEAVFCCNNNTSESQAHNRDFSFDPFTSFWAVALLHPFFLPGHRLRNYSLYRTKQMSQKKGKKMADHVMVFMSFLLDMAQVTFAPVALSKQIHGQG